MYWYFLFSDIKVGETKLNQERTAEFSPQLGVIVGTEQYKIYIHNTFFSNLIENDICTKNNITFKGKTYSYYECIKDANINHFEPIFFVHQELSYNFTLDKNDLFIDYNDKKYFLCIFLEKEAEVNYYSNKNWIFGIPFVKKYNFVFDHNSKIILFYENEYNNKSGNTKINWFVWIIIILLGTFSALLALYLIIQFILRPKRIQANELEDSFNYNNQKNNNQVDFNAFYNSKYSTLGI